MVDMASSMREAPRKRIVPRYAFNAGLEVAIWTGVRAVDYRSVSIALEQAHQSAYNDSLR